MMTNSGIIKQRQKYQTGTSLVVQWLRLHASTAGGTGSIFGWRTRIPHATPRGHREKESDSDIRRDRVKLTVTKGERGG